MATIDLSQVPAIVSITNNDTKPRRVAISGTNQSFIINAGDTVKVRAELSTELIGYLSQDDDRDTADKGVTAAGGLQVTYEAVPSGGQE